MEWWLMSHDNVSLQLKNLIHTEGQQTQVHERLLAGSTAGVISQTTVYPMEVSSVCVCACSIGISAVYVEYFPAT